MHLLKKHGPPKFSLHPFALSGLFLLLFAMPHIYAFSVLSCVILHEAGHLTAALLYRKRPLFVKLMPTGISIGLPPPSSYLEEIVTAFCGPLMNMLYIAAAGCFPSTVAETVRTVAFLLGILNLLPLKTFDGGRILGAALALFFGEEISDRVLQITTALTLTLLWILSLYIFFYSGINMTLLLFCAYLFSYFMIKKQ